MNHGLVEEEDEFPPPERAAAISKQNLRNHAHAATATASRASRRARREPSVYLQIYYYSPRPVFTIHLMRCLSISRLFALPRKKGLYGPTFKIRQATNILPSSVYTASQLNCLSGSSSLRQVKLLINGFCRKTNLANLRTKGRRCRRHAKMYATSSPSLFLFLPPAAAQHARKEGGR